MVRATFAGYTTALSALQANQKRLDITGQNLSNMNTTGYTRQQLKVSSFNYTNPISHYTNDSMAVVGYGVKMESVTQIRDPYLDVQYRNQIQRSGYTDSMQTALDRLADIFDDTQVTGIRNAFNDIQTTLGAMQDLGKVSDPIYESELRNRMQTLTNMLNNASRDLTAAEQDELRKLDGTGVNEMGDVQNINNILQQVGQLNREIKNGQIAGMDCLELMDERNVLLDELASYIPIEVTYYKDAAHDGIGPNGKAEEYYLDGHGNTVARRDWPDDLRVEMVYQKADGTTEKLTLVEGTIGKDDDNYGKLQMQVQTTKQKVDQNGKPLVDANGKPELETVKWTSDDKAAVNIMDSLTPPKVSLQITGLENYEPLAPKATEKTVDFIRITDKDPTTTSVLGNHFASGSVQASLDMLWQDGTTDGIADVRGFEFYRNQLDTLASSFAKVMNEINIMGTQNNDRNQFILANKTTGQNSGITAENIGLNSKWVTGDVRISYTNANNATEPGNSNDTILRMLEAMQTTYPYTGNNLPASIKDIDLKKNSFGDYMNYTSTILANDSYRNSNNLKTNVTVLNGIQNSRDEISGVSLDEEASNMMMYMSAYNAASRLMTTLDEALNTLINNTGLVGR